MLTIYCKIDVDVQLPSQQAARTRAGEEPPALTFSTRLEEDVRLEVGELQMAMRDGREWRQMDGATKYDPVVDLLHKSQGITWRVHYGMPSTLDYPKL